MHGSNVERMLFLVRVRARFTDAAVESSGLTRMVLLQLGYIVDQNAIKANRLYTLDGQYAAPPPPPPPPPLLVHHPDRDV